MAAALVVLVMLDTFLSGVLLVTVRNMRAVVSQLAEVQQSQQVELDRLAGGGDA